MDNKNISYERYGRQLLLKQFGETGQQKLLQARVLVVGAGGLGCPALQYLAAAGVGAIGIVDDDIVALSNLHRQVLYTVADIGLPKVERAAFFLQQLNPDIIITSYNERLTTRNALDIIGAFDIIVDGTDNFSTRYMINDACVLLDKPLVYGAVSQFEGQVAVFNHGKPDGRRSVNYRDLFPQPVGDSEVQNCAEAGVLGVLPGIIGTMQANEVIKMITGIGQPLINCLLTYNALSNQVYELELSVRKETESLIPANADLFRATDYNQLCSSAEIDLDKFDQAVEIGGATIIDVREPGEYPLVTEFYHIQIPLSQLREKAASIPGDTIILFCQSGKRSLQAVQYLSGLAKNIYSLKGGILHWKANHQKKEPA
jgi:adenylyltransferase/sulfurtransferase